jgi:hypothetical protein
MSFEPVRLTPDSVLVYAQEPYLEIIEEVKTRKTTLGNLSQSVEGIVRLEIPDNTRISHTEVEYRIPVRRYVEMSFEVPVTTRNVPYRRELFILPDVVTIQFRCPFEQATDISPDDFRLVVDYPDFVQKESGRIIPLLEASPNLISHVILAPQFVDGIIQNRY